MSRAGFLKSVTVGLFLLVFTSSSGFRPEIGAGARLSSATTKNRFGSDAHWIEEEIGITLDGYGYSEFLTPRIPQRAKASPEMASHELWSATYKYEIRQFEFGELGRTVETPGYRISLKSSDKCISNPYKGSCSKGFIDGAIITSFGKMDYGRQILRSEPLTDSSIPLAFNITGYLYKSGLEWIDGTGWYNLAIINTSPIEHIILANAANDSLRGAESDKWNKAFDGLIGAARVKMNLRRSGKFLWGTYYHNKGDMTDTKQYVYIVGAIGFNGDVKLKEYDFPKGDFRARHIGTLVGKITANNTFKGSRISQISGETMSIKLLPR